MTALAAQRRIEGNLGGFDLTIDAPVQTNVVLYKGALACADATGLLVPGAATTGLRVAGWVDTGSAKDRIDMTGVAAGTVTARLKCGIYPMKNSAAADAITQTSFLQEVFLVDDQTVAKTDGGVARPIAGQVMRVDSNGIVWIAIGLRFPVGSPKLDALINSAAEQLSANGPISVVKRSTMLAVSGTMAFTLAAGTIVGQRKTVAAKSAASTPNAVITPAAVNGYATVALTARGQFAEFEWNGTAWDLVGATGTVA
jgi:hypothetical protein